MRSGNHRAAYKYLLASLLLASSVSAASARSSHLADDTLIVVTKPGQDTTQLKADLYSVAKAQWVTELHANRDNWSIFLVTPPNGQREATLAKLAAMSGSHPEIKGFERNYANNRWAAVGPFKSKQWPPAPPPHSGGGGSGGGGSGGGSGGGGTTTYPSPPNDTDYSQQWTLPCMNWTVAQANDMSLQKAAAHITILATGVEPNTTDNELGAYITQYNATGKTVVKESLSDVDDNTLGRNTPGEGSIDCQMSGSLTDNKTALSGAASFGPYPADLIMLRIASAQNPDSASESAIDTALMWALNNQTTRGGEGPINLSYGTDVQEKGATPLWSGSDIVSLCQSFANQGDVLVVSSGDAPGTWTGSNATIPTGCIVAQGSDKNNALVNTLPSSTYGSGAGLTTVYNDPIAAPGTLQPCMAPNGTLIPGSIYGTSFSSPFICSAIAMMRTVNSNLTCAQCYSLLVSTGTTAGAPSPAISPSWTVVVPNFHAALTAAAAQ